MFSVARPTLVLSVTHRPGLALVVAEGDIDQFTVADFRAALREAADRPEARLVVDLAAVDYLDSSAVYALWDMWKARGRRPEGLALRVARPSTAWVLHTAGLGPLLEPEGPMLPAQGANTAA